MRLSDDQLIALHKLADKQAGATIGWINIGDASALTDMGLARRNRAGWEITRDGESYIQNLTQADGARPPGDVIPFPSRLH